LLTVLLLLHNMGKDWCQLNNYSKPHGANRMITWPMTSKKVKIVTQIHLNLNMQRRRQNLRPRGTGKILVGHQNMASARARAYNGGLRTKTPAGFRGKAPGQEMWGRNPQKLKAFLLLDVSWCSILQCSLGFLEMIVWHSPRLKLHGNQQEIGVSEGNEKRQGIKIPGIAP